MDDSRKVQECMEVMRNIVLHALGLGKGGAVETATIKTSGKNHHISPESSLGNATQRTHCAVVTPVSRNSSGFGSIPDEDTSDTSPLQQSHDSHVTKKHPKSPFTHQVESTRKAPEQQPALKGGSSGGGGVLETKVARMASEKRKLVMTVQELQIKVKEEEIRSVQCACARTSATVRG